MTDDDAGGRGVKWRFLDDVICERPLTRVIRTEICSTLSANLLTLYDIAFLYVQKGYSGLGPRLEIFCFELVSFSRVRIEILLTVDYGAGGVDYVIKILIFTL